MLEKEYNKCRDATIARYDCVIIALFAQAINYQDNKKIIIVSFKFDSQL